MYGELSFTSFILSAINAIVSSVFVVDVVVFVDGDDEDVSWLSCSELFENSCWMCGMTFDSNRSWTT